MSRLNLTRQEYKRRWSREYRKSCKDKGVCLRCGSPVKDRHTNCLSCRVSINKGQNQRYKNNPGPCKALQKKLRAKAKKEVFDHYGRKCAWCGETNPAFLTIDHINNDGNRERLQYGSGGVFYLHVVRAGFPTNLQVLCFNCNCAKGFRGYAPSTFIGFQDGDGI